MNMYFVLRRRPHRHPRDRHHPRGHHPLEHHRARRQARPPGRGAAGSRSTSGARASRSGRITEVFACGTAAVVTPVGALQVGRRRGARLRPSTDLTMAVRQALVDIQYGRAEDTFGWMHRIV